MNPFAELSPPYSTIVADPPWPYADAPMGDFSGGRLGRFLPYSVMGLDEMTALPVGDVASPGAHLYLWTTQRFLWDAHLVAERWGWVTKKVLTWCKTPMGHGGGGAFANTTEFILYCRRPVGMLIREARKRAGVTGEAMERAARADGKFTRLYTRWEADDCYPTQEQWSRLVPVVGVPQEFAADPAVSNSTWFQWQRGAHSAKPAAFFDLVERVSPGPYVELFARAPRLGWDSWGHGYESAAS